MLCGRYHPEILDALCFPCSLEQQDTSAATAAAAAKKAQPFSSLDCLLQLLKQAPELLTQQPKLLAGMLRVLAVLWEFQATAHGAVELLRAQPELWQGLRVSVHSLAGLLTTTQGCLRLAPLGMMSVNLYAGFSLPYGWAHLCISTHVVTKVDYQ